MPSLYGKRSLSSSGTVIGWYYYYYLLVLLYTPQQTHMPVFSFLRSVVSAVRCLSVSQSVTEEFYIILMIDDIHWLIHDVFSSFQGECPPNDRCRTSARQPWNHLWHLNQRRHSRLQTWEYTSKFLGSRYATLGTERNNPHFLYWSCMKGIWFPRIFEDARAFLSGSTLLK